MSFSNPQSRIRESMHEARDSTRQIVSDYPFSVAMAAFGLGFGVGIALVQLMTEPPGRSHDLGAAHRLGRQVLDAIANAVPESLMKHHG